MRQLHGAKQQAMIVRNSFRRWRRPLAALAALTATLTLGLAGRTLPGIVPLFGWGGLGLLLAGSAGLFVWHVARLRMMPTGRAGMAGAALPAALLALVVPGLGAMALLVPCGLAIRAMARDPESRALALLIHGGALALATSTAPLLGALACSAIPAMAWLSLRGSVLSAANDNPSMERPDGIWPLHLRASYASTPMGNLNLGGEQRNVQWKSWP